MREEKHSRRLIKKKHNYFKLLSEGAKKFTQASIMMRLPYVPFLVIVLIFFNCGMIEATKEGAVIIGIVTDGPMPGVKGLPELFLSELEVLAENEFAIEAPPSKRIDGDWSIEKITKAIETLESDPDVDMVLALGPAASHAAVTLKNLTKPTFAPFVINDQFLGSPRVDNKSGMRNLNYLTSSDRYDEELKTFREVAPFTRLGLLIDDTLYQAIPDGVKQKITQIANQQGVQLSFVAAGADVPELLSKIPGETQAVMIGPLLKLDKASKKMLIEKLIDKKLPSFGWMGQTEVEEGVLISTRPASDLQRISRRMALNMQAVIRGEEASEQPVLFERKRQLRINMGTARAIGLSPRFEILSEAILLNEDSLKSGSPLTLEEAAQESIKNNLSIIAGELGVKADAKEVAVARSALFPQIESSISWNQAKDTYPTVENGTSSEGYTEGAITLKQILFSENTLANLAVQKHLQVAREAQQRTLELDVVESATTAFLNVLVAETQLNIQQDNLTLARDNLELAKDRVQTGTVDVSDVYRWESEIATARQNVLAAKANMEKARDNLNLILHRPISERFLLYPATLREPGSLINREELPEIIDNPRSYNLMGEFLVKEGIALSPELSELDARIKAQQRQLTSDRLAFVSPDVSLTGGGSHIFDETRVTGASLDLENETNWEAGVEVSLPLFEGGKRFARASQSKLRVDQLRAQYDERRERIEEDIRRNLHAIRASYPSIELSAQGAEAARKNFELVRENYAKGTRSIVDLLDAQNASLAADQIAANAIYSYLIDLMKLQRSIGEFDFFTDNPQRDEIINRMMLYIANNNSSQIAEP